MPTKTPYYFYIIALVALCMLGVLWPFAPMTLSDPRVLVGAAMLVVIAFISEMQAFSFGTSAVMIASIAYLPFLACIILFPPELAVPAISIAVAASNLLPKRRRTRTVIFNINQAIITSGFAGLLYHNILPPRVAYGSAAALPAFAVVTIVFTVMNMSLVTGGLAAVRRERFKVVWGEVAGDKGGNLVHGLLASPVALLIVLLYQNYHEVGIVVVLLPLLLVRYSFANNVALQKANKDLLKVLIKAIETRDPYTSGHSLRVATLAVAIAEDLRLPKTRVDEVEIAALLHDVGKIDPSFSAVIRKPYDLTPEERALIQTHAALGADLLANLKSVRQPIIDAVRHHHERMDGGGYPDGLVGEAIPLPARIIMLCDSIDAMLSDRPYRKALSLDRVRQELVRCSGDQFDAEIVKVVLQRDTLAKAIQLVDTVSGFEDEYLIRAHA